MSAPSRTQVSLPLDTELASPTALRDEATEQMEMQLLELTGSIAADDGKQLKAWKGVERELRVHVQKGYIGRFH